MDISRDTRILYDVDLKQISSKRLFLVSIIISPTKIVPLFIVDNVTFGLNQFNTWKSNNGFDNNLSKIEELNYISPISN